MTFRLFRPVKMDSLLMRRHPGYYGKFKGVVCLQDRFKKGADQRYHAIIKTAEIRIFQWYVIFVDQDDRSCARKMYTDIRKEISMK